MRALVSFSVLLVACVRTPEAIAVRSGSLDATSALVIAQVYAGGGNTGASFDRDFVVLVNRSTSVVSTDGLSLQYASASGTTALGATDATRTSLPAVALAPGEALLVEGASGANGAPLGAVDVGDGTPLALATSGGRLALVLGVESLGCNGGSSPCADDARARVLDLVGWGTASFSEGDAARAPANDSALLRGGDGCTDTGDNSSDFVLGPAAPRKRSDPPRPCVAGDAGVVDAAVPLDASPDAAADAVVVSAPTLDAIQGTTHRSAFDGLVVEHVRGVVTSVSGRRISIESVSGEGAPTGMFCEVPSDSVPRVGSLVEITGTVRERRAECSSCSETSAAFASFAVTTIVASSVVSRGEAQLREPVLLGAGGLTVPDLHAGRGAPEDRERAAALDPEQALDFLEAFEGRRVRLDAPRTASATHGTGAGAREVSVVLDESRVTRDARGEVAPPTAGAFGQRVMLVDGQGVSLPDLDLGDRFIGDVVGVLDHARGRPVIRVTLWSSATRYKVAREVAARADEGFAIASYNVHNLSAASTAARFAALATAVVDSLRMPDVLALQEVQDDDGSADQGETSAARTLARIVDAIVAAGGPAYDAVDVAPLDGDDGGQPGGNIRPALLVRRDGPFRVIRRGTVDSRVDAAATRLEGRAALAVSPARIGVSGGAFVDGRKPLVVELEHARARLIVVVAHLRSRLGDQPRLGRLLPPTRPSEGVRAAETSAIAAFVESLRAIDPESRIVVVGDFNDPSESPALAPLFEAGLVDALADVPSIRRATYVFDGVGEGIDGLFMSETLAASLIAADVVHVDAGRALGDSDHDPIHASFRFPLDVRTARGCSVSVRPLGASDALFAGLAVLALTLGVRRAATRARRGIRPAPRRCP